VSQESKEERFRRIAVKRTNDIIERIRILGNCSNKGVYKYTDSEVSRIFSELEKHMEMAKGKFAINKKDRFEL